MSAAIVLVVIIVVILLIVGGIYASKSSSSTSPISTPKPAPAVGTPAQYASNPATTKPPTTTTTSPPVVVKPPASPPAVVTPSAPINQAPVVVPTTSSVVPPPPVVTPIPCDQYKDSDVNLRDECIKDIWFNVAKCPNDSPDTIPYYISNKVTMTKLQITNDAKAWASMEDDNHRKACYGTDKTKWPAPTIKFPRIPIVDGGYEDNRWGSLKKGYYDIVGQGAPNDYCRYVGDNPNVKFMCQLSDKSNVYASSYNNKDVTDIITNNTYTMKANYDAAGNDIACLHGVTPDVCKAKCNNDNNCVAYNEVKKGIWGPNDFGCCYKSAIGNLQAVNNIDFYTKNKGNALNPSAFIRYLRNNRNYLHY